MSDATGGGSPELEDGVSRNNQQPSRHLSLLGQLACPKLCDENDHYCLSHVRRRIRVSIHLAERCRINKAHITLDESIQFAVC
jgi:hypothetical protein